jgi:hypothetical protein
MASRREDRYSQHRSFALINRSSYTEHSADDRDAAGPVTDYGSTMLHWIRNRQPRWKGGYQGEMERPSPSYIVDVSRSRIYNFLSARDFVVSVE